jgi:hypothetical protein
LALNRLPSPSTCMLKLALTRGTRGSSPPISGTWWGAPRLAPEGKLTKGRQVARSFECFKVAVLPSTRVTECGKLVLHTDGLIPGCSSNYM